METLKGQPVKMGGFEPVKKGDAERYGILRA
jgi:hypothetical protein